MNREKMLSEALMGDHEFDFIIIGGGATGIGIALEAVTRGYKTLLLEKHDFTKSTSSKSTKLVHGGVRYLAQGDIALVREACIERGRLLKNAPHLVKNQSFVIPTFGWFDELLYTTGLTFYDLLAGGYSLGRSLRVSKKSVLEFIPTVEPQKITAGVVYHDGQFDDSRLAINVLQTATENGAIVLNYMNVTKLTKSNRGIVNGVVAQDSETGNIFTFKGRAIVNATGVFADDILQMDKPGQARVISPSQGVHIMLDKRFLPGTHAMMIPKTDDGRVLFAVPWHNRVVVGTTDTPVPDVSLEPVALEQEVEFILSTAGRYLTIPPKRSDVLSVFAGLRPLAAPKGNSKKTKEISRSHKIFVTKSELFTMVGGKWTTFRKMAEDMVNKVEMVKGWGKIKSKTRNLQLHGYTTRVDYNDPLYVYGSDREELLALAKSDPEFGETLSQSLGVFKAQVVWAARHEMARTVEDVLARRTRCLLLDARESIRIAPAVASLLAKELNKDKKWEKEQVEGYTAIAQNYILS